MSDFYTATATGERFHASPARVKCVRGPVGCLPGWTEVMTPGGWVRIDRWEEGCKLLEWDHATGIAKFARPRRYIRGACDGMLELRCGKRFSMTVTPNHRVPLWDWSGKFAVKTAAEVARRPSKHVVPTTWIGGDELSGWSDSRLRLWVAIAADGYYPKRGRQCVFVLRKQRKVDRLERLLAALGIEYSKRVCVRRDGAVECKFAFARPEQKSPQQGIPQQFNLSGFPNQSPLECRNGNTMIILPS